MKTAETNETTTSERLTNAAGERAKGYVDVGVKALNAVSGKAREFGHTADGYVRENPWLMIGAAAGVGVLVGFLLRRSRES